MLGFVVLYLSHSNPEQRSLSEQSTNLVYRFVHSCSWELECGSTQFLATLVWTLSVCPNVCSKRLPQAATGCLWVTLPHIISWVSFTSHIFSWGALKNLSLHYCTISTDHSHLVICDAHSSLTLMFTTSDAWLNKFFDQIVHKTGMKHLNFFLYLQSQFWGCSQVLVMRDESQIGSVHETLWCMMWTIGQNGIVVLPILCNINIYKINLFQRWGTNMSMPREERGGVDYINSVNSG